MQELAKGRGVQPTKVTGRNHSGALAGIGSQQDSACRCAVGGSGQVWQGERLGNAVCCIRLITLLVGGGARSLETPMDWA